MSGLIRVTSVWTGFPGQPGYTNFYAKHVANEEQSVADDLGDRAREFWAVLNGFIPGGTTLTVDPTWQSLDDATGQILSEGSLTTAPIEVDGLYGAVHAGNAGVAVNWQTNTFLAGHRLKGRSYLVPFSGCFDTDGTLEPLARQAVVDAATDLLDGPIGLAVWHRPVNGAGGSSSVVTSATVTDRAAILRSRSI